jgi:hypothetical protein
MKQRQGWSDLIPLKKIGCLIHLNKAADFRKRRKKYDFIIATNRPIT